jgi:thiol-disulfide isomerase/thioredoxin
VAHDYPFAQNLILQYDQASINVYIVPGDSVFITIDAAKLHQHPDDAIAFSGDNARVNEQLFRWTSYASTLPIPDFNPAATPDVYLASIKQCFSAMQDTIAAYARREKTSDFVRQWAFIDYKFRVANTLLAYADKASRWSVFTDPLFDVYNEQNFQSMFFQYHLIACVNALVAGNEELQASLAREEYGGALRAVINELSGKTPEGTVRDMLLYLFAHKLINKTPGLYDSTSWDFFSRPLFNEKIASLAREKLAGESEALPLAGTVKGFARLDVQDRRVTPLPGIDLIPYLLERHKNKVLYADVWATWCAPCIEEMKYMPALHDHFAGKGVVFIAICLNSTAEEWTKTVYKEAIPGEHYYLDEDASKAFLGANDISGFPTYMLIDKEGKSRGPVARPSNTRAVIKQIETRLRE